MNVQVKAHKRKGKVVKAHTRSVNDPRGFGWGSTNLSEITAPKGGVHANINKRGHVQQVMSAAYGDGEVGKKKYTTKVVKGEWKNAKRRKYNRGY